MTKNIIIQLLSNILINILCGIVSGLIVIKITAPAFKKYLEINTYNQLRKKLNWSLGSAVFFVLGIFALIFSGILPLPNFTDDFPINGPSVKITHDFGTSHEVPELYNLLTVPTDNNLK